MKQRFCSIIEKIKETGVSKKILNVQNFKELSQVFDDFEDDNNDIIKAIKNWNVEYNPYRDSYIILRGEKIEYPIEVLLFIFFCPCDEDYIIEENQDLINALNSFDSKVAKAFAQFIKEHFLFEMSTSLFYIIKYYME